MMKTIQLGRAPYHLAHLTRSELKSAGVADSKIEHSMSRFVIGDPRIDEKAEAKRQFTGLASTWDLDQGGDMIEKGAYRRTIRDWKSSGRTIPLINQHNYYDVLNVVGKLVAARETDEGLETTFQVVDSQKGNDLLSLIKEGMLDGLSIGYETRGWRPPNEEEKQRGVFRVLTDVELKEVSVVIWGMNQNALIDASSVKSLTRDVATALAALKPDDLSDDDRKTVRQIAAQCGALLRAPEEPKTSPVENSPTADASKAVPNAAELANRIRSLRLRRVVNAGRRTL
jgi:HK97 family phage prohead protease